MRFLKNCLTSEIEKAHSWSIDTLQKQVNIMYNRGEIMRKAWAVAKELAKQAALKARAFLSEGMKLAWAEAKHIAAKAVVDQIMLIATIERVKGNKTTASVTEVCDSIGWDRGYLGQVLKNLAPVHQESLFLTN